MGQKMCCVNRPDLTSCLAYESASMRHPTEKYRGDELNAEVAVIIATDRSRSPYQSSEMLPMLYDVRKAELYESQHTCTVTHKRTGVVRLAHSFKKPVGVAAQTRLKRFVGLLQSLHHDSVCKVLEVFEDYKNIHLIQENCSGGSVYNRILERQYFTEQESAVIVKHMLLAVKHLHDRDTFHGNLCPNSFRFLNNTPHSALKLSDFGLDLKIHRWDATEPPDKEPRTPPVTSFYETCHLVFVSPEFAPPYQSRRKKQTADSGTGGSGQPTADGKTLQPLVDEVDRADCSSQKLIGADMWSIGAMAFLLLCGYPPFFAPSKHAILGRIHRTEFSFDPPFWSKISEEAKSFVQSCLRENYLERMTADEALQHPWIESLADTSPSGAMFSSFMLNLRRFYRTCLIETFVGNVLAEKLSPRELRLFLQKCREMDVGNSGFFTATDLQTVLTDMHYVEISDQISSSCRFLRAHRHPGESYIDYVALADSVTVRQERLFEESIWKSFCFFQKNYMAGCISLTQLPRFLHEPDVRSLVSFATDSSDDVPDGIQGCQKFVRKYCDETDAAELEFFELAALMSRYLMAGTASDSKSAAGKR
mmetsp:Transcript_60962/g.140924  ORF Transcript_60962/g.140924 Transcript_60962/m.140924 type:complete len:592 (-) Transcript_60962:141-1916(-)